MQHFTIFLSGCEYVFAYILGIVYRFTLGQRNVIVKNVMTSQSFYDVIPAVYDVIYAVIIIL